MFATLIFNFMVDLANIVLQLTKIMAGQESSSRHVLFVIVNINYHSVALLCCSCI